MHLRLLLGVACTCGSSYLDDQDRKVTDHLSPGVWEQPGQHSEASISKTKKKEFPSNYNLSYTHRFCIFIILRLKITNYHDGFLNCGLSTLLILFFFFFFFGGTVVWTQSFILAKQALYCLNHTSSPFWRWGLMNYFVCGWPQTRILPISVSQVARITGMSYLHPASFYFWLLT
jgi:hypothetical protein